MERRLADAATRRGPVGYAEVIEAALYDRDHGFYASGGRAGRHGDFLTNPEVGPLFGAVLARWLDKRWVAMGRPDPFVVADAGAGPGTLARSVVHAAPACAPALVFCLVERSVAQRARHEEHLRVTPPDTVGAALRPAVASLSGLGEVATVADRSVTGEADATADVVIANELVDNLAFDVLERTPAGWAEVRVAADAEGGLVEALTPPDAHQLHLADRLAPDAPVGGRIPAQDTARAWLVDALELVGDTGTVLVVDYAATTAELATRPEVGWLRTYRGHDRGGHPLDDLGDQDITAEVALDQLSLVRPPRSNRSQADFLAAAGIHELVDEGRAVWQQRAATGDLAALAARSRVREAEALGDMAGLGAFRVVEWSG